jgi:hypothetical protein
MRLKIMLSHNVYPYPDIGLIAQTLNLRKVSTGFIGSCSVCNYPGALSVRQNQGGLLTYCHAGCKPSVVFDSVCHLNPLKRVTPLKPQNKNNFAQTLWEKSISASSTLVETYLKHRGYQGEIPESIRFLATHLHTPTGQEHPVMIAQVSDQEGRFQAVHRTYLKWDGSGKASVVPAKMTFGSIRGGAIRLAEVKDQVILCEGIETGLALFQESQLPVWSCLSAGGLKTVNLPSQIQTVIIAADYDKPGLQAAEEAAARFYKQGLTVKVIKPKVLGSDFADELLMS